MVVLQMISAHTAIFDLQTDLHIFDYPAGPTTLSEMDLRTNSFDVIDFLVVNHDSIRGCVRPLVGPSVGPSIGRSVGWSVTSFFWRAETKTANDLFRVYKLVNPQCQ